MSIRFMNRQTFLNTITKLTGALLLSMIIIAPAVTGARSARDETPYIEVKTEKFEGVIVPLARASDFVRNLTGSTQGKFWEPGRDDVLLFEEGLEDHLRKARDRRSPELWRKLGSYKRQYVGVMENGRKVIYANFFCDALRINWTTRPVAVEDGGDCYFQIKYEVETKRYRDLHINGEA